MRPITSMPREKQEEAVWLTAYIRALRKADPLEAEIAAIDALRRFRVRWAPSSLVPEGIDPEIFELSRMESERVEAEFRATLARDAEACRG